MKYPDDYINKIICGDCLEVMKGIPDNQINLLFLDPPFDVWEFLPSFNIGQSTTICFTNFQNREYVTRLYGKPRVEIIWHFPDGRWVSNNFPQLNHENILVYGELGNSFVGEKNTNRTPVRKGKSCIGKDKNLGDRIYTPKERHILNSVLTYPRNMNNKAGCFGKPIKLIDRIIEWLTVQGDLVLDPFCGIATCGISCAKFNRSYIGIENNKKFFEIAQRRLAQEYLFT